MPLPMFLMNTNFIIELVYSVIIMVSCLVIYFKTREIYNLSSHKGIKYFGMAFLFFAITYFLRFFSKILILRIIVFSFVTGAIFLPQGFNTLFSLLVLYTGFMTTFYLLYSLSKKRLGKVLPESTDTLHILAVVISSVVVILNLPVLFVGVSAVLLLYMFVVVYSDYSASKTKVQSGFLLVYFLLILFLMLNIFDLLISDFFGRIQTLVYIVSLSLFLIILYKVLKILGVETNGRKKKQA